MAWLTREDLTSYSRAPKEPDMETLSYWLSRLEPIIRAERKGEIIVVLANRCGSEDDVVYAGTSCVLGINAGEVKVYGILGRGEKGLLVVDTSKRPKAKLISEPASAASTATNTTSQTNDSEVSASTAYTDPESEPGFAEYEKRSNSGDDYYAPTFSSSNPSDDESYRDSTRSSSRYPETPSPRFPTHVAPPPQPIIPDVPPTPRQWDETIDTIISNNMEKNEVPKPDENSNGTNANSPTIKSPPFTAGKAPNHYQSTFTKETLGPREEHVSPRPRSAFW